MRKSYNYHMYHDNLFHPDNPKETQIEKEDLKLAELYEDLKTGDFVGAVLSWREKGILSEIFPEVLALEKCEQGQPYHSAEQELIKYQPALEAVNSQAIITRLENLLDHHPLTHADRPLISQVRKSVTEIIKAEQITDPAVALLQLEEIIRDLT